MKTVRTPRARRTGTTAAIAGVEPLGEQKGDSDFVEEGCQRLGIEIESDTQGLEHIRRAAPRRDRSIAVFGHRNPTGRRHQRGRGGDVDRLGAVAAGAAGVDGVGRRRHPNGAGAHGASRSRHLGPRLALGAQRHEQPGDLGGLEFTIHNGADERFHLIGCEIGTAQELLEDSFDSKGHSCRPGSFATVPGTQPCVGRKLGCQAPSLGAVVDLPT